VIRDVTRGQSASWTSCRIPLPPGRPGGQRASNTGHQQSLQVTPGHSKTHRDLESRILTRCGALHRGRVRSPGSTAPKWLSTRGFRSITRAANSVSITSRRHITQAEPGFRERHARGCATRPSPNDLLTTCEHQRRRRGGGRRPVRLQSTSARRPAERGLGRHGRTQR
jgi:hypothetical protein